MQPRRLTSVPLSIALLVVVASAGGVTGAAEIGRPPALGGAGLVFDYPGGLPELVAPGVPTAFQVQVTGNGGVAHEPGTARLFVALAGAAFEEVALADLGGGLYEATLPAASACADALAFFLTAEASGGGSFSDPPDAPGSAFEAIAALGREPSFEDDFEGDVSVWTVINRDLGTGGWEQAEPNGTATAAGTPAAPDAAASGLQAFVTGNGPPGGDVADQDVDRGPTDLLSPPLNLLGVDAQVSYSRWFFSQGGVTDLLEVAVSADGEDWSVVERVQGDQNSWIVVSFRVSDFVVPSETVQVRFRAMDVPNDSVTEAAVDAFRVERLVCTCDTILCDDADFCNGVATCGAGVCQSLGEPCDGLCDELSDACVGTLLPQERMGEPLRDLTSVQLDRFLLGREAFQHEFTVEEGLGPIFNDVSCSACHNVPLGGSGTVKATRFGTDDGGVFDPLVDLGGSLLQEMAIEEACEETVPDEADRTALRLTTPALGSGLVEAIPDGDIEFFELNPPAPAVSGRAHVVSPREDPGASRVGRFGWKSQEATVMSFSSGAVAAEQGITNRFFPDEQAPNGDAGLLADCDTVADPEDRRDTTGFAFIDRVTDFQRFLAPPPQTPRAGMTGEALFDAFGCAACHVAAHTTGTSAQLEPALRGKTIRPYSDFLLHNMGDTADFIAQNQASPQEMRTTPLWGVRVRDPLWHDGRAEAGTFESRIREVIDLHNAPGSEAGFAANRFTFALPEEQAAVIAFLDSLGRAEFDLDGDGDVDFADLQSLLACHSGPGDFYTPDAPCSVFDADQDGDVDDVDVENYLVATDGAAGSVPDGAALPGAQLRVDLAGADALTLSWGESCSPLDADYEIYEGPIGDFAGHLPLRCSTGGSTSATITPGAANVYFLVVPTNGVREGGHGTDSTGEARPPGPRTCLPQNEGVCGGVAPPEE